jgi:hypothetical protein
VSRAESRASSPAPRFLSTTAIDLIRRKQSDHSNPFPPPPLQTNPCSGQLQGFPLVLSPARLPRSSRTSLAPSPPRSNMHANKSVPITSLSIQSVSSPHILQWSVLLEGSTGVRRRGLCTRLGKPPGGRLGSWMRMLIGGTRVEPSLARGWND